MVYFCAVPIGNLEDVTLRVLRVLKEVDYIAAEDTRQAQKLLNHYQITARVISFHRHNETGREEQILAWARDGKDIAVISDAGMPGISDPGGRLATACATQDIPFTVLPGPNAAVTALLLSGLPLDAFYFGGFLPRKSSERKKNLEEIRSLKAVLIFYEAPHRLLSALKDIRQVFGDRQAAVARELTKWYEETRRGSISHLEAHFEQTPPKGELVILVAGAGDDASESVVLEATSDPATLRRAILDEMEAGASKKEAIKNVARRSALSKNEVYQHAIDLPPNL